MNRIEEVKDELEKSVNDPEDLMLIIMEALNNTVTPIPEVGQFYTFISVSYTHLTLPTIYSV